MYNICITFKEVPMNQKPRLNLDELEQKQAMGRRRCEHCGQAIPRSAELNYCANCQDTILFREVKEYIRTNNVTAFQVSEHFNIPLSLVKQWMRERRIEYVGHNRI